MDLYTLISTGLDDKLKCLLCKNYLSYFPISICSNNQNICGRCTVPEESICYQEEALEALCNLLRFPCRYQTQGCCEELVPEEVPQHEESCSFRVVKCILTKLNPCSWSGSLPTLLSHLQNEHPDQFLKNGEFKVDISCSEEYDFLMEYDKNVIICTQKFESHNNILHFTLDAPYQSVSDDSGWQICVKSGNTTLLHDLNPGSSEKLSMKLCLLSVIGECKEESLLCKIQKITNTRTCEISHEDAHTDVFKCGVCHSVATRPIYRCPYDMSIKCSGCEKFCHPSVSCPPSKKDDKMSRLVKLVNQPCKNRKNGCNYVSVFQDLKTHESFCCYRSEKCPLYKHENCDWEGLLGDVYNHVTSKHPNSVFKINSEHKVFSKDSMSVVTPKFIQFCERLFRLDYFVQDNCYAWSVQSVFKEKESFRYEIDIVDVGKSGQRFRMRKNCAQTKDENIFRDISKCCFVLTDQLCSMVEHYEESTVLTFKIRIFK